jgi:nucleotide-binding universal stress UspA family protein
MAMMTQQNDASPAIMAATDLSESADEGVRQADDWAKRLSANLIVCHVTPSHPRFTSKHVGEADVDAERVEAVAKRVSDLTQRRRGEFQIVIAKGSPATRIVDVAGEVHSDLVVIGTRGESGLDRILVGGTSERVVRDAPCSVLVARRTTPTGLILAATDLSDPSLPAVTVAAEEARRRGARLHVLQNVDPWPLPVPSIEIALGAAGYLIDETMAKEERERVAHHLHELMALVHVESDCLTTSGAPDVEIVRAARRMKCELLVIGTHGRTGLARLALGSVAERVIETAPCSVLVGRLAEAA